MVPTPEAGRRVVAEPEAGWREEAGMEVLTTSAKERRSDLGEEDDQEFASSRRKRPYSAFQFGPPLPQRKKNTLKELQVKDLRLTMEMPTDLVETTNLKVRSANCDT